MTEIEPRQILKVLIGSRAHGTATDTSDIDERLIYVSYLPLAYFLSLLGIVVPIRALCGLREKRKI